jgi:hypothetical protein
MNKRIEDIVANLTRLGRYSRLLNCISEPVLQSFLFELLFANVLETNGLELSYEVGIRPGTNATVDFVHEDNDGTRLAFELVSPEMSNQLKAESAPIETGTKGVSTWSVLLEGSHHNPHLRPQAQTIRMQEKLLEKVDKFPEPAEGIFSTIVVDCSAFHFGHFDGEDSRMVFFGRTQNPYFQEYWSDKPIMGILNPDNNRRGAKEFRERITAVVFIPEKDVNLFDKAFLLMNVCRSESHLRAFWLKLKSIPVLGKLRYVPLPGEWKDMEQEA